MSGFGPRPEIRLRPDRGTGSRSDTRAARTGPGSSLRPRGGSGAGRTSELDPAEPIGAELLTRPHGGSGAIRASQCDSVSQIRLRKVFQLELPREYRPEERDLDLDRHSVQDQKVDLRENGDG